jgi:hypothetical protein
MAHTYVRNIKMRDLEEIADMPEQRQAVEIVARCYGLAVEVVLDMDASEFEKCSREVAIRNGLSTDE